MVQSTEQDGGARMAKASDTEVGAGALSGGADTALKRFLPRVFRINALLIIAGVIAARVAGADMLAVNFFAGSMIGLLMLYTTARLVRRYLAPSVHIKRNRIRLLLLLLAKLPLIGVVLFFVTSGAWFHPIGLFLGVSMIPFTLTLYGLGLFVKQRSAIAQVDWTAVLDKSK